MNERSFILVIESGKHSMRGTASDASSRRERILEAALELFAARGFHGTSVRSIAERASVAQGLLYNYFDGKKALLLAVFHRSAKDVERTLDEADRAEAGEEAVRVLVRAAFRAVARDSDFWRLTYQLRMQEDAMAPILDAIAGWAGAVRGRIQTLLERAGAPSPEIRAHVLFAAIDGAAQHWVLDPDHYPVERVADELATLILTGVSTDSKRKTP